MPNVRMFRHGGRRPEAGNRAKKQREQNHQDDYAVRLGMNVKSPEKCSNGVSCCFKRTKRKGSSMEMDREDASISTNMIAAQAAARAHLKAVEHERLSREENLKRSQLALGEDGATEPLVETKPITIPDHLLGVPLKDRDSGDEECQTFLVVAKKFGKQYVYRFHASKSLYIFSPRNRLRRFVIFLITHQYFELLILLTILTNCVFLAINNPPEEPEFVFAAIYTAEMILKIIGRGFALHKYAYLRNAWNWLDFLVVVLGYITMLPSLSNLSGIRTFRVLRALRTISAVKGLKAMVNTLLKSIIMLSDVLILTTFFMCVFALIGLQFFAGAMTNKCVKDGWQDANFSEFITRESNWYIFPGDKIAVLCGNDSNANGCPVNYTCFPDTGPNPISRYISYANFAWSLLTSLQLVTMDFWESIYNSIIATKGPLYVFYFLFVIFLGPFYLINLVLAVVSLSYEQETAAMQDEELRAQLFAKLKRTGSTYSFDGKYDLDPMYEEDVLPSMPDEATETDIHALEESTHNDLGTIDSEPAKTTCWKMARKAALALVNHSVFETFITLCILFNTLAMALEHFEMDEEFSYVLEICNYIFTAVFIFEMVVKLVGLGFKEYAKNRWNLFDGTIVILSILDMIMTFTKLIDGAGLSVLRTFRLLRVLKLAQSWKTMGELLNTIGKSIGAVGNIIVILGIIVYMLAVVGMHVFRGKIGQGQKDVRWTFDDFGHSFMMIFRILCGKLIEPLWATMDAYGPVTILFVLPAFIVGNFVILNLFLALLLNSFGGDLGGDDEADEEAKKKEKEEKKKKKKKKKSRLRINLSRLFGRKKLSGSRSKVGPDDENSENEDENSEMIRSQDDDENENKKEAASTLAKSKSDEVVNKKNSLEMSEINGKMDNTNGFNCTQGNPSLAQRKGRSLPNDTNKSLTTMIDVDEAAHRIRELPDSSSKKTLPAISPGKSEGNLESSENNLSNGDLVANGNAPVVPNGNSRLSAGSDRSHNCKDLSLGDIESRIPSISPNHDSKRDTIVTVDTDIVSGADKVRDCCPSLCYCESNCCASYKESCLRRSWHSLRYHILMFVEHKYFELFILVMIGISSLTLVFEDIHLSKYKTLESVITMLNYTFAVTFTIEMLLKLLGFGIVGYFSNLWNCLDSFIVAISLASITGSEKLNAFRSLRALRPLRAVSRFEGMKIVVNSLVHAVPAISNVLLVCMIFWLIFSIIGYQLFGGRFYKCQYENGTRYEASVVPDKNACLALGNITGDAIWVNSKVNFDSSLNGFLALFQVATLEGVFEVMYDAVDSVGQYKQPIFEHTFPAYFYFVIFIIMGAFFFLNLFIGVIIENFNQLKQQYEDSGSLGFLLTAGQRRWVNTIKKTYYRKPKKQPKRPKSAWRGWIFDLIHQRKFEVIIMSVIMINMLTMMLQHHNQTDEFSRSLDLDRPTPILNYIFTGIFVVEAIIRLLALKLDYFKQAWNLFDFVIVIFSIVGIIMDDVLKMDMTFSPGLLRVVRVFRIGRLLRFFEGAKGIRRLLFALMKSIPGLVNIATLLFLIIFIYAIIGMSSFAYVKKTNGITDVVNFETFGNSMLLLFRIGTAAGWNTILGPMMIEEPHCDRNFYPPGPTLGGNCGKPLLAVFYFCSYIMLIFLIIVNMYIAVILENFNDAQSQEEIGITDDDLETFILTWEKYDQKATQFINYSQLEDFLDELDPPMQMEKPSYHLFGTLDIPLKANNRIYCVDLMQSLIRKVIGKLEDVEEEDMGELMQRLEDRFSGKGNRNEPNVSTVKERFRFENRQALKIQRAFRIYLLKKKIEEHCNTKFHKYENTNDSSDKNKGKWREKQLKDNTVGGAGIEAVIGMLWYNQGKKFEEPQVEVADETVGTTAEGDSKVETTEDTLRHGSKEGSRPPSREIVKRHSSTSNC